jgi:hypothetical protein
MEVGEKINLENFGIRAQGKENQIDYAILWNNWGTKLYKGNISGSSFLMSREGNKFPMIELSFDPGSIMLGDTSWLIPESKVIIDTSAIDFNEFYLVHNNQYIYLDGKLSRDPSDESIKP